MIADVNLGISIAAVPNTSLKPFLTLNKVNSQNIEKIGIE